MFSSVVWNLTRLCVQEQFTIKGATNVKEGRGTVEGRV